MCLILRQMGLMLSIARPDHKKDSEAGCDSCKRKKKKKRRRSGGPYFMRLGECFAR